MDSVKQGAILAIQECQMQFRNRRWNCSSIDKLSLPGNILNRGKNLFFQTNFNSTKTL